MVRSKINLESHLPHFTAHINQKQKEKKLKRLLKFIITLLILASIIFILFKVVKIDDIIMKKLYPLKYSEYVEKYAKEYNIDKYMVYAIIKAESNFKENAK